MFRERHCTSAHPITGTDGPLRRAMARELGTEMSRADALDTTESSERRFRSLVANAADAIVVLSADGDALYVSPSLLAQLDIAPERFVTQSGLPFVHPDDLLAMQSVALTSPPEGEASCPVDLRLQHASGAWNTYEGICMDLSADTDVCGFVWNLRNVSVEREAVATLAQTAERFRALAIGSHDVPSIVSVDGSITFVGPSLTRTLGYRSDEWVGHFVAEFLHPDDVEVVQEALRGCVEPGAKPTPVLHRLRHKDGSWRWMESVLTDQRLNHAVDGLVVNMRDVTERQLITEALQESERRHRTIVETAEEGIWIHDANARGTFANPKMAALLGTTVEDLHSRSMFDFVCESDRPIAAAHLDQRRSGQSGNYELRLQQVHGEFFDALISATPLFDADGLFSGALKMVTDITARKRAEAESARLALHDPLTGLANRALVLDRIGHILERQTRHPGLAAVLFLDLDGFKAVNDSLGHSAGDRLLCEIAARVSLAVRPEDTVGRLGGDEFVVITEEVDNIENATALAARISKEIAAPVMLDGSEAFVTASIGIALSPSTDAATFLSDADTAMYRAKALGRGRYVLFDDAIHLDSLERAQFEAELHRALDLGQFDLAYQPIMTMDGAIAGVEALLRWEHPLRGTIASTEFVGVAEATGLSVSIGAWMIDHACRALAGWRASGHEELSISVNISARQLSRSGFVDSVASTLLHHGLAPRALTIEITEDVLTCEAPGAASLLALGALGVGITVDSFGTGYSSLVDLRRLPIGALKLDRSLVAGLGHNAEDRVILQALVDLAHNLGLRTVADGVESHAQMEQLSAIRCDYAQGDYWHSAVTEQRFGELLALREAVEPTLPGHVSAPYADPTERVRTSTPLRAEPRRE